MAAIIMAVFSPRWLSRRPIRSSIPVRTLEYVTDVPDIVPRIVGPFVPALEPQGVRLIVSLFIFLDEAFEAYVSTHFESEMIALEQQKEPGNPAVSIAERMDAQKVEIERGHRKTGWTCFSLIAAFHASIRPFIKPGVFPPVRF